MKKIPQRLHFYVLPVILVGATLLFLVSLWNLSSRMFFLWEKEKKLSFVEKHLSELSFFYESRKKKIQLANLFKHSDLDETFKSISLLNLEKGLLLLDDTRGILSLEKQERLAFIEKNNRFQFQSLEKLPNGTSYEIHEKLLFPVEIEAEDLPKILSLIEEKTPLRIKTLRLEKQIGTLNYSLYFELWRKEIP